MKLNSLPKTVKNKKRRVGRGVGSGRGKTSGRGTKGQKARSKVRKGFEGGQLSLLKRLPFKRGKNRNPSFKNKPIIVNIKYLNLLPQGSLVTIKTLIKHRIVKDNDARNFGVKILGDGDLEKKLNVSVPCSRSAAKKIKDAGGSVAGEKEKEIADRVVKSDKKIKKAKK